MYTLDSIWCPLAGKEKEISNGKNNQGIEPKQNKTPVKYKLGLEGGEGGRKMIFQVDGAPSHQKPMVPIKESIRGGGENEGERKMKSSLIRNSTTKLLC